MVLSLSTISDTSTSDSLYSLKDFQRYPRRKSKQHYYSISQVLRPFILGRSMKYHFFKIRSIIIVMGKPSISHNF